MTALLVWLLALAPIRDGRGLPIRITAEAAIAIATACVGDRTCATRLFVIGAHESGYRTNALGDGGRSKGIFQTPTARAPDSALGQARVAIMVLEQAERACPLHPIWAYASGACRPSAIARLYEREIAAVQR